MRAAEDGGCVGRLCVQQAGSEDAKIAQHSQTDAQDYGRLVHRTRADGVGSAAKAGRGTEQDTNKERKRMSEAEGKPGTGAGMLMHLLLCLCVTGCGVRV